MSTSSIRSPAPTGVTTIAARDRRLLQAGVAAGPTMVVLWFCQGLLRDGYDFSRHPMSLLAVGDHGWIQIANFALCGGLLLANASGLRRVMRDGRGSTWVPRLFSLMGVGLVASGIFTTNPGGGLPAGAPEGAPSPACCWSSCRVEVEMIHRYPGCGLERAVSGLPEKAPLQTGRADRFRN